MFRFHRLQPLLQVFRTRAPTLCSFGRSGSCHDSRNHFGPKLLASFVKQAAAARAARGLLHFACCWAWLLTVCVAQERQLVSNVRLQLGTGANLSASVRAGDVDADGDLDLVVANGRHWPQQNLLFFNQGRARFNVARPLGVDRCTTYACELADLDGDGDLDIAVANDHAPCLVFLNDGFGVFVRHGEFGTPSSVRSLAARDLDGDGDIDLLVTCRGQPNRVHWNDGKAGFDRALTFGSNDDATISVAVADLNNDGHNDLILANREAQPDTILLATGRWHSGRQQPFEQPKRFGRSDVSSRAVAAADFDSDGHVDWVTGHIGQENTLWYGDGNGGVKRSLSVGAVDGRTYCVAVADLNNDRRLDIVFGNAGQPNAVLFNTADNRGFSRRSFGLANSVTYGLCVGDVTGDGFADIVVANSGQPNRIYVNQPQPSGQTKP